MIISFQSAHDILFESNIFEVTCQIEDRYAYGFYDIHCNCSSQNQVRYNTKIYDYIFYI